MKRYLHIVLLIFALPLTAFGQEEPAVYDGPELPENLTVLDMIITDEGDTLFLADLPLISVTGSRLFLDMSKYRRMKRNATKAYPYAKNAVALLKEIEKETELIEKKRHQRKYLKRLEKELKTQFKDELTNLTTTQGKILVKMIERGTGKSFYKTLKNLKNPVTAILFQGIGKRYGYDLKQGYDSEKEWMLERIILELEKAELDKAQTESARSGLEPKS